MYAAILQMVSILHIEQKRYKYNTPSNPSDLWLSMLIQLIAAKFAEVTTLFDNAVGHCNTATESIFTKRA